MELRHLRYLVAVADAGTIGRAAELVFVSPSPLSRQLRDLQDELGVALLEPAGRRLRLTAAGEVFVSRARAVLADVDAAVGVARQIAAGQTGTIRIGFETGTAYFGALATVVGISRRRNPRTTLDLTPMSSVEQWSALSAGRISIGFGYYPPPDDSLDHLLIARDRLGLVLAHDDPLAATDVVRACDLRGRPVLMQPRFLYPRLHDDLLAAMRTHDVVLDVVSEIADLEALLALVAAGDGLTFLPERGSAMLALGSAAWRPLADVEVLTADVALWRGDDADDPLLRPLLDIVREVSQEAP